MRRIWDDSAADITLGLLGLFAGVVFMGLGEDVVAATLGVLGVLFLAGSLQRLPAE